VKSYWTFLKTVGEYNVWTSSDGYFQVTQSATPPDTTAGYKNLDSLLKLKGITR